jgi:hypothetical protein
LRQTDYSVKTLMNPPRQRQCQRQYYYVHMRPTACCPLYHRANGVRRFHGATSGMFKRHQGRCQELINQFQCTTSCWVLDPFNSINNQDIDCHSFCQVTMMANASNAIQSYFLSKVYAQLSCLALYGGRLERKAELRLPRALVLIKQRWTAGQCPKLLSPPQVSLSSRAGSQVLVHCDHRGEYPVRKAPNDCRSHQRQVGSARRMTAEVSNWNGCELIRAGISYYGYSHKNTSTTLASTVGT